MDAFKNVLVPGSKSESIHDDEMQLPEYKFDPGSVSDDDDDDDSEDDYGDESEMSENHQESRASSTRKKIMTAIWVVICSWATLNGRKVLMGGFRKFVLSFWGHDWNMS